jgi:hypothetical protein
MQQFSDTQPIPAVPDTVAGLFHFPTADQLLAAADQFPRARSAISSYVWQKPMLKRDGDREVRGFAEGIYSCLEISPGAVKFKRRNDAASDRQQARLAMLRELRKSGFVPELRPLTLVQAVLFDGFESDELHNLFPRPLTRNAAVLLGEFDAAAFNVITFWSRKSQNNLKLVVSQLDLAPMLEQGSPAMITYTLPGDWLAVTPDAAAAARIWNRYRTMWADYFGTKPRCIWKREFQRRGAPHWHEWTVVPEYRACTVCKGVYGPVCAGVGHNDADRVESPQKEISALWTAAVFGELVELPVPMLCTGSCEEGRGLESVFNGIVCAGCERVRNLAAGTRVDYSKGASARDPRRLATYFLKESGDVEGKSYQNRAPAEWAGQSVGRFWGIRGIERAIVKIDLDPRTGHAVWRVLRKLRESQRRADRRKIRVKSSAGFVLVHDGANVASQLARFASSIADRWIDPMEFGGLTGTPAYLPAAGRFELNASDRFELRAQARNTPAPTPPGTHLGTPKTWTGPSRSERRRQRIDASLARM